MPGEPHPPQWYETYFSKSERDLLYDYFDAASGGTVDVSGSRVFGWFQMPVDSATLTARNNTTSPNRTQTAADCRKTALDRLAVTGPVVDVAHYASVITVINVPVDSGATGQGVVINNPESTASGLTFLEHEMLHMHGFGHSWRTSPDTSPDHVWGHGGDVEYNDCWDMMSAMICVYTFSTSRGPQGPELQAEYRERIGWLPSSRVDVTNVSGYAGPRRITLAPVSDPSKPGSLLARIEVPNLGYYAVEYHERSRFDRAIPYDAVVIREVRPNLLTYLVTQQNGEIGWRKGELFSDSGNGVSVAVDDIAPGGATIMIGYSFGAVPVDSLCGDKFQGGVRECPVGSTCRARRTGSLVSIDWFCLVP